jgi:hypothetical protein
MTIKTQHELVLATCRNGRKESGLREKDRAYFTFPIVGGFSDMEIIAS